MKSLTVKGIREKSLLENLKKIYPSKLNLHDTTGKVTKTTGRYIYDDVKLSQEDVANLIMKESLNYKNTYSDCYIDKDIIKSEKDENKSILECLNSIETKISNFLFHTNNEWDNKENRDIWVI